MYFSEDPGMDSQPCKMASIINELNFQVNLDIHELCVGESVFFSTITDYIISMFICLTEPRNPS